MNTHGNSSLPPIEWINVSVASPCPICEKPDWCSVSADGRFAACRRVDRMDGETRTDASGATFCFYRLDGGTITPPSSGQYLKAPTPSTARPHAASSNTPAASAEDIDAVYSALLRRLTLSDAHRESLLCRGHTPEAIKSNGYRTLPLKGRSRIARNLVEQFGEATCRRTPGIIVKTPKDGGDAYWTLSGAPGILIPVRDYENGNIVSIQIRLDEPGEHGKYQFLSSSHAGGAKARAPVHSPAVEIMA